MLGQYLGLLPALRVRASKIETEKLKKIKKLQEKINVMYKYKIKWYQGHYKSECSNKTKIKNPVRKSCNTFRLDECTLVAKK